MEIKLSNNDLSHLEKNEIESLLKRKNEALSDIEQIWHLMDLVWDDCQCNNKAKNYDNIEKFYSHSVWLLNGLFIEQDKLSMQHRNIISDWIINNKLKSIIDYGGGFGTLACLLATKNGDINVSIYEPHPSEFSLKRINKFKNITIVNQLNRNYDCLVSTDVLEHVFDPLVDFAEMIKNVKFGGYLIIANCFYPVIKCHLPQNFHFRYSFNFFAKLMGLKKIGLLQGSHATLFKKVDKQIDWRYLRFFEKLSKFLFPIIESLKNSLRPIKYLIIR